MKNWFLLLLLLARPLYAEKIPVLVTAAPYVEIVSAIGGNCVDVHLFVPEGVDLHNFEPSPSKMEQAIHSSIWFAIGEPFEAKLYMVLQEKNNLCTIINLQSCLLHSLKNSSAHAYETDPHIWMSIRLMQQQVHCITEALIEKLPEKKEFLLENEKNLEMRLQQLDNKFKDLFKGKEGKSILTVHDAFSYFCKDYGLEEIIIEKEGKEPTAHSTLQAIQEAKTKKIETVFYQLQSGNKIASVVAEKIDGKIQFLNPVSLYYFDMLEELANAFSKECR